MKKILLVLPACLFILCTQAQPSAFQWPANGSQDQGPEQGPCHIFATAASVTSWMQMLYTNPGAGVSVGHLYSFCTNANPGGNTNIDGTMNWLKLHGAVDRVCVPYSSSNPCTLPKYQGSNLQYISSRIDLTRLQYHGLVNDDCETPWCNCTANITKPTIRYRIGDYAAIGIGTGTLTTPSALKLAVLNNGPISFWMHVPSMHNDAFHYYTLYGWDASGNWLLMDSWEGQGGYNTTNLDLISIFVQNPAFQGKCWTNLS